MRSIFRPMTVAIGLVSVTMWAVPAGSTRVQPMVYELTPSGARSQQDLRVENNSDRPLPLELRAERRFIATDGTETRASAEDDFLIFPPQGIVPPNGFQTFRVKYVGDPLIAKTSLYVITVAQLPLDSGTAPTGVQILVNLGTSVAVTPEGATPKIAVTKTAHSADGKSIEMTIANTGARFARLYNGVVTFTAGTDRVTLEGEALRAAIAQPLIEAQSTRVVSLAIPEKLAGKDVTADFGYTMPIAAR